MEAMDQTHLEFRSRICDVFLVALAVISVPTLAASLWRVVGIGWQPVMALHILLVVVLGFVALYRRRLPYGVRAGFLVSLFVIVGLAGIWSFGLLTAAGSFFVVAPILCTVLFNIRSGLIIFVGVILVAIAIGTLTVLENRLPAFDLAPFLTSAPAWVTRVLSWVLTGGTMAIAIGALNKFFVESLKTSQRHAEALEESESQYRRLINNLPEIVYSFSDEGGVLCHSRRIDDILGYSPEYLTEHPSLWHDSIHPDDLLMFVNAIKESRNGKHFDLQYRIRDAKENWHWFHDRSITIRGENGKVFMDGLATDITEQRQAEEQLRQSQKMEAVGHLAGGIAHDFNNLLHAMSGNSELLEGEIGENEQARQWLEEIKQSVDRASSLTYRLLAYSRQQVLSPAPTDITDLVSGLYDLLQRTLGEKIELKIEHGSNPCVAKIDPHQFENALVNLAINARDAMPNGGVLVIETANVHLDQGYTEQNEELKPGDYIMVAVSDTGTGMPPDVLEKVFEPFFTTKEVGKGSGLGLSMVHGFVKQSNGCVSIHSEIDSGTTIKLHLPASHEAVAQKDTKDHSPKFAYGTERILIVEDDPKVRMIPVTILRNQGYDVVEAENGDEAIKQLQDGKRFDLLFTDVILPGSMSGLDVAEKAKTLQPKIKTLYTTGYAEDSLTYYGKLDPGVTLVNKPYRRAELLEKVRVMLDRKSVCAFGRGNRTPN